MEDLKKYNIESVFFRCLGVGVNYSALLYSSHDYDIVIFNI